MGEDRDLLDRLLWKFAADSWADVAPLADAHLVEYLLRVTDTAFYRVVDEIPARRLAAPAPDLDRLIAAAARPGWFHQRVNHTNAERERLVRAAVRAARTSLAVDVVLNPGPQEPAPCPRPPATDGREPPVGDRLAEPEAARRELRRERELLREERELVRCLRREVARERVRAEREFRRRLAACALGTFFAAASAVLLAALRLR